jgi:hypothetical protein
VNFLKRTALSTVVATLFFTNTIAFADNSNVHDAKTKHVLLISVDGLHQADLDWFVTMHPQSTLAKLVREGSSFTRAFTPYPSDSFPGMVGQVTGGRPGTTGIYYDDAYNRRLLPAGTTDCKNTKPGAEVNLSEVIAKDPNRLDSGQQIPGLYSDFSKISQLTGQARDLIDPATLPVDPNTCLPVYPHQYLKVNTVFEVVHQRGLRTAWSDKHEAYEILNGPSGNGINDLFSPEINSSITDPTPPNAVGPDWTKDNTSTQFYDALKVKAVINWLHGYDHAGTTKTGVPAILGLNFQSVSTAQKLNTSKYYIDPNNTNTVMSGGLGGYTLNGAVPGPVLQSALTFVDDQLANMMKAVDPASTTIILSSKHGQSPQDRSALTIVNDGDMIDALNCAWENNSASCKDPSKTHLVAHAMDDDGILMWLNDRSPAALRFAKNFLWNYSGTGVGSDAQGNAISKSFTHAGTTQILAGDQVNTVFQVKKNDNRAPDLIGYAQYGTVWAGGKLSKIAEHGGHGMQDRHVPIVMWGANVHHTNNDQPVLTTQIAPTILKLLGFNPEELDAVRVEHTKSLLDAN